jgi:hypothetical protein
MYTGVILYCVVLCCIALAMGRSPTKGVCNFRANSESEQTKETNMRNLKRNNYFVFHGNGADVGSMSNPRFMKFLVAEVVI